jgi:(p)ppGpp synthase/HD superfamily hydrolase
LTIPVEQVAALAIKAHGEQLDLNDVPYREHLRAVAGGLAPFGPLLQMAGWLHDVLEDTDMTADGLRAAGVPDGVVEIVKRVTREPGGDYLDMIRRIARDPEATLVKIADNAHNSIQERNAGIKDPAKRRELAERYRRARRILWPATTTANVTTIISLVNPALLEELPPSPG